MRVLLRVVVGTTLVSVNPAWADIPAPPVNQSVGMRDVLYDSLVEAECRVCHGAGVSNRHHLLYGKTIPADTQIPYPDTNGDGVGDTSYGCLNCHNSSFVVMRDCVVCHDTSPHHATPTATSGDCKACHGSVVDNMNDGHYIPTYQPSLVTPTPSGGDGLPANARGIGAGACNYCHDDDNLATPVIRSTSDLHHGKGFNCSWCHKMHGNVPIRVCEGCHGPDSLHNIQADSPAAGNTGTIVVGGEDAGYGHVGRDAGPGDSDCWSCHGFAMASAPGTGPIIPTLYKADRTSITTGPKATLILTGSAFTNTMGNTTYDVDVVLSGPKGSVTLQPDVIVDEGMLSVTLPANLSPGSYDLQASKASVLSNPVVISVLPKVKITSVKYGRVGNSFRDRAVTIIGSGFAGYAKGSATAVTAVIRGKAVTATVVSWTDTKIVAKVTSVPSKVTVTSVFGKAAKGL